MPHQIDAAWRPLAVAAHQWKRNRKAAIGALLNGGTALGNAMLTNYPGGLVPLISFRTHARIEAVQAAMAGAMPEVLGFRRRAA